MNIRKSGKPQWNGEVKGTDRSFCTFCDRIYGVRAGLYLLYKYRKQYDLITVKQIVHRWAPAYDGNNPDAYARQILRNNGYKKFLERNLHQLYRMVREMCWIESQYVLTYREFLDAYELLPLEQQAYWRMDLERSK